MKNKINILRFKNIKIISIISLTSLSLIWIWVYSLNARDTPECNYWEQINRCREANSPSWEWNKTIDDFLCIASWNREKIAYNIIIDQKFDKIDEWIEDFLESLELDKDEYFWKKAWKTLFDAIPELDNLFANPATWFYKQYADICSDNSIVEEAVACADPLTTVDASDFIKNNTGDNLCMSLAKTKLAVFRQIWTDLLKFNKHQVKKDYSKKYMQEQRTKYDYLIEKMSVNKNYINKIDNKWNVKTKDAN
jgi:hypothetical protein